MLKRVVILCLLSGFIILLLLNLGLLAPAAVGAQYPFPQHLVYAPGTIRPNHRTQTQQTG